MHPNDLTMAYAIVTMIVMLLIILVGIPLGLFLLVRWIRRSMRAGRAAAVAREKQRQEQAVAVQAFRARFAGWEVFESSVDRSFLAINFDAERINIGHLCAAREYPFSALRSAEVIQDGGVTYTNPLDKPRHLGPTDYGILRAVESPTTTIKTVGELLLRVTVDDPQTPVYDITFVRVGGLGADPSQPAFRTVAAAAERYRALLTNAIARAQPSSAGPTGDVDRLKQLWDLKQAGALTEDEYAAQKAKLLAPQ
ncbi:MAG: SHOCT domain-containing protein [Devosia sp.]|nr:SHOCT domain-containing protein [Devosia sp.]